MNNWEIDPIIESVLLTSYEIISCRGETGILPYGLWRQAFRAEGEGRGQVWVRGVSGVKQYPSGSGQKSTAKVITAKFLLSVAEQYKISLSIDI